MIKIANAKPKKGEINNDNPISYYDYIIIGQKDKVLIDKLAK